MPQRIGFKVLNIGKKGKNGYQYEVGVIHEITEPLILRDKNSEKTHENGFHYCEIPIWMDNFYDSWLYGIEYDSGDDYEYWMVEILGDSLHYDHDHISITSKIRLIRQIKTDWKESIDGVEDGILHTLSGDTYHIKDHKLHSEDGPAMILANGYKAWYLNNKIYRNIVNGVDTWCTQDESGYNITHRSGDLPAIINPNGDQYWCKYGKIHREDDKPAFIGGNGDMAWFNHDKLHRLDDKPAVIRKNNSKFKDPENRRSWRERMYFSDIPGAMEWWVDGKMQRSDDKPAKITANGDMFWYHVCEIPEEQQKYISNFDDKFESMLHRDGGKPAIIKANGDKLWFDCGKFISRTPKFGYKKIKNGSFIDNGWVWDEKKKFEIDVVYEYYNKEQIMGIYGYQISETPFDLFMLDSYDKDIIGSDGYRIIQTGSDDSEIDYVKIEILGVIEYHNGNAYTNKFKVIQTTTKQEILDSLVDGMYTIDNGDIFYIKDKNFHRTDGPAIIKNKSESIGTQMWFVNGLLHRDDDLPAIQYTSDSYVWKNNKENNISGQWWTNGKRHRLNDLPAIVFGDEHQEWWIDGQRHRADNKPAIIKNRTNSSVLHPTQQEWWYEGKQHRDFDEPAIIKYCNEFISFRSWIVNGMIHRTDDNPAVIYTQHNGLSVCEEWYEYGLLHRADDKPARITNNIQKEQIIWTNVEWYDHGLLHRSDDKPAMIKHYVQKGEIIVMSQEWYERGVRHRNNDLPAIDRTNGHKEWYDHGIKVPHPKYKLRKSMIKKVEKDLSGFLDKDEPNPESESLTHPESVSETNPESESSTQDGLRHRPCPRWA
jgi:hypothetical protein